MTILSNKKPHQTHNQAQQQPPTNASSISLSPPSPTSQSVVAAISSNQGTSITAPLALVANSSLTDASSSPILSDLTPASVSLILSESSISSSSSLTNTTSLHSAAASSLVAPTLAPVLSKPNEPSHKVKLKSNKKANKRKLKPSSSTLLNEQMMKHQLNQQQQQQMQNNFINLSQSSSLSFSNSSGASSSSSTSTSAASSPSFSLNNAATLLPSQDNTDLDQNEYYRLSEDETEDSENIYTSNSSNSKLEKNVYPKSKKVSSSSSSSSSKGKKKSTSNTHNASNKIAKSDFNNNSGDEYEQTPAILMNDNQSFILGSANTIEELEEKFCRALKEKKGFIIKPMKEDGACLFRSVADQIYGDEEMHSTIRCHCMDYIAKNADYFKQYMTEDVDRYLARKRQDTCFGNHIEIIAIAEIYNRPIEVYEYSTEPKNTFQSVFQTDYEPIRLSYHGRMHYNSVVNPYKATIGVGLGLPQLVPGQAEKNLLSDALKKSEEFHIEQAMLDDKLKATDWEATNEDIMELVARESYLQWLKDNEKRNSVNFVQSTTAATCSSWSSYTSNDQQQQSTKGSKISNKDQRSSKSSPSHTKTANSSSSSSSSSKMSSSLITDFENTSVVGQNENDNDILAKVLAESQQEYLDSLKMKHQQQRNHH